MLLIRSTFFLIFLPLILVLSTTSASLDDHEQVYVVHMDPTKVAELDRTLQGEKRWYQAVMDSIIEFSSVQEEILSDRSSSTTSPKLLYVYETVMSGFSAKLSTKQLKFLQNVDGFLFATPDEMLNLHTTHSPSFLGLHPGEGLWSVPNTATDVIVGVVDTGVWPEHVSFREDEGVNGTVPGHWRGTCEEGTRFSAANCNKKLIGARAFFKGYEAAAGRVNETVDFRSPRDAQGHGTHTASTAVGSLVPGANMLGVAKGRASGMSFASRIAAYKVCWPAGCASSDIYAAINQAVSDGVDILSLSLGGTSRPYYVDGMAIAAFGAVQKGVFVSASAGNSGPRDFTVSNTAPWIMTVAASYLDREFLSTVVLGDGRSFKGASLHSGKPTKQLPLAYGEYCTHGSLSSTLVKGKIVGCDRGFNGRTEKGEEVKRAGGVAMLLLNTDAQGEERFADAHVLPASSLGAAAAKAVREYAAARGGGKLMKPPTAKIVFDGAVFGSPAPTVAAFSSRGPSSVGGDVIKPDVTAPGVNILAGWPPTVSPAELATDKRRVTFNLLSGTSMSCPHVSGLAALIKSVHPGWSPAAIKSALMTTAYTVNNRKAPVSDAGSGTASSAATPFAFGSGHVDPKRASDPGLVYDVATEDYLNYFCSLNYSSTQREILVGKKYDCPTQSAALQAGDLNYPSFAVTFGGTGNVKAVTYARTVTNVAGGPGRFTVSVREPKGVSVTVEPEHLVFTQEGEKMSYKVKFEALAGQSGSGHSYGELVWVSGSRYSVRSPIAISWK